MLLRRLRQTDCDIDMFHGAAPDVIALALQKVIPQLSYDSRHLVFALFGVAGIYYLYRFGSKFVSEWTGVFAALFLAATPMWFGYMFINHKDIPFATLLLAASYYSLLALTGQPASSRFWVKTGLAIGLFAATKLVGLLLLAFVVVVYLASLATFPSQKSLEVPPDVWRRAARLGSAGVLGCLIAFLLFWPQFYFGDIAGPGGSQGGFIDTQQFSSGRRNDPYYAIRYFVISTPVFLLGLAAAGAACAVRRREASVLAAVTIFALTFSAPALAGARVDIRVPTLSVRLSFFHAGRRLSRLPPVRRGKGRPCAARDHRRSRHLCFGNGRRDVPAVSLPIFLLQFPGWRPARRRRRV